MNESIFGRCPKNLTLLIQWAMRKGVNIDSCLTGTEITICSLCDPAYRAQLSAEIVIMKNILLCLEDLPGIGISAGLDFNVRSYGVCGFVLCSTQTLLSSLEKILSYLENGCLFSRVLLEVHSNELHFVIERRPLDCQVDNFVIERDMGVLISLHSCIDGAKLILKRILLQRSEPANTAAYIEYTGVRPEFGQIQNRLIFDICSGANDSFEKQGFSCNDNFLLHPTCLKRNQRAFEYAKYIAMYIRLNPGKRPSMEFFAEKLSITSRTLRRMLKKEGVTYREVVDTVRQKIAAEIFSDRKSSVEEVAEVLGYSDSSSLSHALKRWKTKG
ncbi:AraC family transcriptional regulator [Pseudomonas brenneri]